MILQKQNNILRMIASANNTRKKLLSLKELEFDEISYIKSFLFDFSKIQDTIGNKFFKEVLLLSGDISNPNISIVEVLNKLVSIGVLNEKDIEIWNTLRYKRNFIAHEYEDNFEIIIDFSQSFDELILIFDKVSDFLYKILDIPKEIKILDEKIKNASSYKEMLKLIDKRIEFDKKT